MSCGGLFVCVFTSRSSFYPNESTGDKDSPAWTQMDAFRRRGNRTLHPFTPPPLPSQEQPPLLSLAKGEGWRTSVNDTFFSDSNCHPKCSENAALLIFTRSVFPRDDGWIMIVFVGKTCFGYENSELNISEKRETFFCLLIMNQF